MIKKIILSATILSLIGSNLYGFERVKKDAKKKIHSENMFNKRKAITAGVGMYQLDGKMNTQVELGIEALQFISDTNFSYGFYTNLGFTKSDEDNYSRDSTVGTSLNVGIKTNYNVIPTVDIFFGFGGVYGINSSNDAANGGEIRTGMGYDLNSKFYISVEYVKPFLGNNTAPNIALLKLDIKY
jgi:hypothetical protein